MPKISSSDRTTDLEARTIYKTKGSGSIGLSDTCSIKNVADYGIKHLIQRGHALCKSTVSTKVAFGKDSIYNTFSPKTKQTWIISTDNRFILGATSDKSSNPYYEIRWKNKFGAEPMTTYDNYNSGIVHVSGAALPSSSVVIDPSNDLNGFGYLKHTVVRAPKKYTCHTYTRHTYIGTYKPNVGKINIKN